MRAKSDIKKEPQPKLRKSIHDYAEDLNYPKGSSRSSSDGASSASASNMPRGSLGAKDYARNLNNSCAGHWKKSACLSSTGYLTRELMNDYYKKLSLEGNEEELNFLIVQCEEAGKAVTTAVNEQSHAKAMQICVNTIAKLSDVTKVKPDMGMYKLASWSVICMANGHQCTQVEKKIASIGK